MRALRRLFLERFAWLIGGLCFVQVVAALLIRPGTLVIDEVTYHAMTRALVRSGSLALDNGWDVFPSPELEWEHSRGVGGSLVAQYPAGFPIVAAPLYALLGPRAFFVLNTLAYYGTILVTRALALHVLRKRSLATAAALIFALGTYAWEYSFAIWPHAVTLFLCTSAVLLSLRPGAWRQLAAGALVGAATTMRLDALFAIAPLLLAPALVPRAGSTLLRAALAVLGLAPGVALLAFTNHAKFGSWQPLSYGPWHGAGSNTGLHTYLPLAVVGALSVVAVHLVAPRADRLNRRHVVAAVLAIVVVVAAVTPLRGAALKALDGLWFIVLDLRHSNPSAVQRGLAHSPHGAMMYVGGLKKAFVQSLPWLPLAFAAPCFRRMDPARRRVLLVLSIPVLVHVGVFGALGWHGGLCLNLRYLLPATPFAAILATSAAYRLVRRAPRAIRHLRDLDAIVLMVAAGWLVVAVTAVFPWSVHVHEVYLLDTPLVLAAAITAALIWRRAPAVVLALSVVAVVWGGMTELFYDGPKTIGARLRNHRAAEMVSAHTPPGAFVFAEFPDLVSEAMDQEHPIAEPARDAHATVAMIVRAAAERGRPSYAVVTEKTLANLRAASEGALTIGEPLARQAPFTLRLLEPLPPGGGLSAPHGPPM